MRNKDTGEICGKKGNGKGKLFCLQSLKKYKKLKIL